MARRENFDAGNSRKDAHGSCIHCGEGLGSSGTQRVGNILFDAAGESVYTKRKEAAYEQDQGDNRIIKYSPGKYCNNCNTDAERADYYS